VYRRSGEEAATTRYHLGYLETNLVIEQGAKCSFVYSAELGPKIKPQRRNMMVKYHHRRHAVESLPKKVDGESGNNEALEEDRPAEAEELFRSGMVC